MFLAACCGPSAINAYRMAVGAVELSATSADQKQAAREAMALDFAAYERGAMTDEQLRDRLCYFGVHCTAPAPRGSESAPSTR